MEIGCIFISQRFPTSSWSYDSLSRVGPHISWGCHSSCQVGSTLGLHCTVMVPSLIGNPNTFFLQKNNRSQEDKTNSLPYVVYSCCLHFFYILIGTFNKWKYVHLYKYPVSSYLQPLWWLSETCSGNHLSDTNSESFQNMCSLWKVVTVFYLTGIMC